MCYMDGALCTEKHSYLNKIFTFFIFSHGTKCHLTVVCIFIIILVEKILFSKSNVWIKRVIGSTVFELTVCNLYLLTNWLHIILWAARLEVYEFLTVLRMASSYNSFFIKIPLNSIFYRTSDLEMEHVPVKYSILTLKRYNLLLMLFLYIDNHVLAFFDYNVWPVQKIIRSSAYAISVFWSFFAFFNYIIFIRCKKSPTS